MVSKDTPIVYGATANEDGARQLSFVKAAFCLQKYDLTMSVFIRLLIMITILIRVVVKVFITFILTSVLYVQDQSSHALTCSFQYKLLSVQSRAAVLVNLNAE